MTRAVIGILTLLTAHTAWAQDPARADGWVVLPIGEYRALRAKAFPAPPDPAPPPVDAALTRVDYTLRVAGDTVTGDVRLTIDVLKQGWVSVQIPTGLLVRDARLDGRRTALVDGTPPRVLISKPGRAVLTLDVVVPLSAAAGTESVTLPPCGSALSAVTLTVPRTSVDLSVTGGFLAERTESTTESRWVVYGSPGSPLTFSWKRKADDSRASQPLRARARVTELVALGEESSQVTASVVLEVSQGVARQIVLALPPELVVNQVQGATVGDWSQTQGSLTVSFLEPVSSEASLVLSGDVRIPREGTVRIPIVRVPSAERETGGVAIDMIGPGETADRQTHGMDPADASDLGDIVAGRESPSMAAFRFKPIAGTAPRDLTLNVSRYTPQAVLVANVEEARYEALVTEDGKALVHARYAVRNNQRSFLAVTLPPQSVLWSAALAGRPVRPGLSSEGALLLPLQKGRAGEEAPIFVVELVYLRRATAWADRGDASVDLPAVDLPVSRTGLTLHHSPRYHIDPKPGRFRVDADRGPWSAALAVPVSSPEPAPPSSPSAPASKDLRVLLDRYQKEMGRTTAGVLPVQIDFPAVGPAVYLAAELTAELQFPSLEIAYKRAGGR